MIILISEKFNYQKYNNLYKYNEKKTSIIASYRMIVALVMLFSFILKYYYYKAFFTILFILSLILFIVLVIIHNKYFKRLEYYRKYLEVIEEYIKRENGEWRHFKEKGLEFINDDNIYLQDLDIIGNNSLFQYLNVCKTIGGKRKLYGRLSNKKSTTKSLKEEQESIMELINMPEFYIEFQILMKSYQNKELDLVKYFSSIKKNDKKFNKFILPLAGLLSFSCLLSLIFSLFGIISINYFYGLFIFNYFLSTIYSFIFKKSISDIDRLISNYKDIYGVVKLILTKDFKSKKMCKVKKNAFESQNTYKYLNKIEIINSLRNNFLSNFILNGLINLNVIILYFYNDFLNNYLDKLILSIKDIEELEAIVSLLGIGILHQDAAMPVKEDKIMLDIKNMRHPLLDKYVPNSVKTSSGINIITGSNMSGKTSFQRTIGINLILMQAGTFVCAEYFHASYFKIYTSMRVVDNIEKGISTFYGELLRIKHVIDNLGSDNLIVFIDEIFKGTNYQDRIYGAKKVIERLKRDDVILFLTTHDFELSEELGVVNYHFQEQYIEDKIVFDYKIKKGVSTSTNAKYLMKKLGIIED